MANTLKNQLAERELIKHFRHDNSWLGQVRSKNNWVGNDVIKIPVQGSDPTVVIDNAGPYTKSDRQDDYITRALHKFDTLPTSVSDDELYALPYEKISDVQRQHRETLEDETSAYGLHNIGPESTDDADIIAKETSGDTVTGRKRLTTADLIELGKELTQKNVPRQGRVLVLCSDHAVDLMLEDSGRSRAWGGDFQNGVVGVKHVGFTLFLSNYDPHYKEVSGHYERNSYGSVSDKPASVLFLQSGTVKARGTVKRYALRASENPENRENVIGFRMWHLVTTLRKKGTGIIVSADA